MLNLFNLSLKPRVLGSFSILNLSPLFLWEANVAGNLWKDAGGDPPGTGDPIYRVVDASGNDAHLTQATASYQCTMDSSGRIVGDHSDDYFTAPSAGWFSTGRVYLFVISGWPTSVSQVFSYGSNQSGNRYGWQIVPGSNVNVGNNGIGGGPGAYWSVSPSGRQVMILKSVDTGVAYNQHRLWLNGVEQTHSGSSSSAGTQRGTSYSRYWFGLPKPTPGGHWDRPIEAWGVFPDTLTDDEILQLSAYYE